MRRKRTCPGSSKGVLAGEEVVISRNKEPVVRLVREGLAKKKKPLLGAMKGQFEVPDSFFDPLPDEELRAWGMI